jgi:hypothetical protein
MLTTGMDNRARPGMAWVSLYRSKFLDCLAGVVQYSYRNVDLLWDNAGDGPAYGASEAPARREPLGGSGRFTESARRRIRLDPIIYRDARHVPSGRRFYLRSIFDLDLLKK